MLKFAVVDLFRKANISVVETERASYSDSDEDSVLIPIKEGDRGDRDVTKEEAEHVNNIFGMVILNNVEGHVSQKLDNQGVYAIDCANPDIAYCLMDKIMKSSLIIGNKVKDKDTGANSGIGQTIACEIARRGGTVHMVCRNHQRGEHVQTTIMNETGNQDIHLHLVDLSQPRNVFRFAQDFRDQSGNLDVLIHNAGSMVPNRQTDPDGIEKNFAVNVLAPHILTRQLIPLLHKAKPGRVIFVASGGMLVQKLDVTDIQCQRMKAGDVTLIYDNHKRQQVKL
ncbi:hypothetical protein LSTR_LSTR011189 [Laodelphax striatellus]|uniref:Uncharacterized protein n=1 Tax=Laodelphax striatellus TaxID=195883 RepID=A0A482XRU8_LAOST|nr:hypothetical protein LSTR_LSTR011189 [Laodelphax striatellus]